MKPTELVFKSVCGLLLLAMAGCTNTTTSTSSASKQQSEAKSDSKDGSNTQTAALEGVESSDAPAIAEKNEELAKVIRKQGKVNNRGGYIKILVNGTPITNYEIQRRIAFLKVRRVGGNRAEVAEKELIEQALKIGEAKRLKTLASDAQVDSSYAQFAKSNRATPAQLSKELGRLGIGASHFKEFIRSQMSWSSTVQRRFLAKTRQINERDVVTGLRKSGSEKPELTEYTLKQIVFVIPAARRNSGTLSARKQEAKAFRQRFPGCEQAINSAKNLKDVTIIDRRRVLEPELPQDWKDPILNADGKGTTSIRETKNGVEFFAVCSKRLVSDDRAAVVAQQAENFSSFNVKSNGVEKEYLDQLRENATIVYQ